MLTLALRNTFRHRTRTLLTLGVLVAGVVAIVLAGGFVEDVFVQLREATIHSQLGHIQIARAGYRAHGAANPYKFVIDDPAALTQRIAGVPQVKEAMGRVGFTAMLNNGRADLTVIGEGVEPDKEARLGTFIAIVAGRQLTSQDTFGILLGEGIARAARLRPGDQTTLLVSTPEGAINTIDFDVVGVFRSFSKEYDDRAVRIPLAAAQELLAAHGINTLVVLLDDTNATDAAAQSIEQRLAGGGFEVDTWPHLADFYQKTVALYRRQFAVLQIIILVAVLLSVANSINVSVFERTGEFGTLKALGDRDGRVFRLVLTESLALGCAGAIVGTLLGVGIAFAISAIGIPMPPPPNSEIGYTARIRITLSNLSLATLVGVGATVVAALMPARRAAKMPVVEALRHN